MNFLQETTQAITDSRHAIDDVIFIGSEETGHQCSWSEFVELANFDYDEGFGAQKIASDLILVFSDGTRAWRYEYDGSEGWLFSKPFTPPKEVKKIKRLSVLGTSFIGWHTLAELECSSYEELSQRDKTP